MMSDLKRIDLPCIDLKIPSDLGQFASCSFLDRAYRQLPTEMPRFTREDPEEDIWSTKTDPKIDSC